MKIINDELKLKAYIKQYNIQSCFEKDMSPYMTLVEYGRGEDILVSGDSMEFFYFVVDGKAKIFNSLENGKSVLLRFTRPLSELGSLEVTRSPRYVHSNVQSLHSTTVISIPFSAIDEHALKDIKFLTYNLQRLSHKLETESNKSSLNVTYPFKNRFASYLMSISTLKNERIDEIIITQMTDLATFLGTSYRHLNRVIKQFEDDKIIKKEKRKFVILDFEQLEALSGGFYE